jgi:hypothetical protein
MGQCIARYFLKDCGKGNGDGDCEVRCLAKDVACCDKLEKMGGKIFQCDFSKPDSLCAAFKDVGYVILVPEMTESSVADCDCTVQCMRKEGVNNCIMLSMIGADADAAKFNCLAEFRKMEKLVETKFDKDSFCVFRCGLPQQMFLCFAPLMQVQNKMAVCSGDGKFSPINMNDICAACYCCVCGISSMPAGGVGRVKCAPMDKKHQKQCYNLTGPECISAGDMCAEFNEACLQECKYESCTREQMMDYLKNVLPGNKAYGNLCMMDEKVFCNECDMNFDHFMTDMGGAKIDHEDAKKLGGIGGEMGAWKEGERCYFGRPCPNHLRQDMQCVSICDFLEFCREGHANFTSGDLKKLTGNTGMSVEAFFVGHKAHFMMAGN